MNAPFATPTAYRERHRSETDEPQTYVAFELANQVFATDVRNVREILDLQPITRLPNATHDLLGMIDVRDEAIAIVDLCEKLSLQQSVLAVHGRIIVLELGHARTTPLGVVADRVLGVVDIAADEIEPPPITMTQWDGAAVSGVARVAGTLTMLLALEALFNANATDTFSFD